MQSSKLQFKIQNFNTAGFTLIELLVAFSIISVISTVSIAAFVDYSRKQTLNTAVMDVVSTLQSAKSRAQSQVKPSICLSNKLEGYEVFIDTSGVDKNKYGLKVRCWNTHIIGGEKFLPTKIEFLDTSPSTIFFPILSGGVRNSGNIGIAGYNMTKVIQVDSGGNVKVQ